jgi:hypothetical protein
MEVRPESNAGTTDAGGPQIGGDERTDREEHL